MTPDAPDSFPAFQSQLKIGKSARKSLAKSLKAFGRSLRLKDRMHLMPKRDSRPLLTTPDRSGIMTIALPSMPELDKSFSWESWPSMPVDHRRRQKLIDLITVKLDEAERRGESGEAVEKTLREEVFKRVLKSATLHLTRQVLHGETEAEAKEIANTILGLQEQLDTQMKLFQERAAKLMPDMSSKDLKRAGTNVWPMLCFQLLCGQELRLTNAMMGMSLLYPLTDDIVDDPALSKEAKAGFLARFSERVANGKGMHNNTIKEKQVWAMFELIEKDVSRFRFPLTYRSLTDLLLAQGDSRLQMGGPRFDKPVPDFAAVWEVTVRKGALSILSDALLVKGRLTDAEISFAAHFGTLTQYLNDARGLEDDLREGQYTPFNLAMEQGPQRMDTVLGYALTHFFDTFSNESHRTVARGDPQKLAFMATMCSFMTFKLFEAIAINQMRFTPEFIARIEEVSPLPMSLMRRLWRAQYADHREGEILPGSGSVL